MAFLVAVSWPGAAAQARSSSSAPSASVSTGDATPSTSRAAVAQPDSAHDHESTAASDHAPAVLAAELLLAIALLGLIALTRGDTAQSRRRLPALGRAPPAYALSPRPSSRSL